MYFQPTLVDENTHSTDFEKFFLSRHGRPTSGSGLSRPLDDLDISTLLESSFRERPEPSPILTQFYESGKKSDENENFMDETRVETLLRLRKLCLKF
jgi:hypothetical protein